MTRINSVVQEANVIDPQVAVSPTAPDQLSNLLQEIQFHADAFQNEDSLARVKLVDTARALVRAMETPQEAMLRACWAEPTYFAVIETCIDLGIFRLVSHSDEPKSVAELAVLTGASEELLERLLKHLATMGALVETGLNEYTHNSLTKTLSLQRYSDSWPAINGSTISPVYALPRWLKQNNYKIPTEGKGCPFNLGNKTEYPFFEYLNGKSADSPELGSQFNNLMSAYHQGRPSWMDKGFYPVKEKLIAGANEGPEDVLIVDVGGNKGHDLEEFNSKWPTAPGRLILQDQPHVLKEIDSLNSAIEPMVHDFYKPQPIKGARAYFLHSILHDWNDETCQHILRNIVSAMTPGYSKILINENVVPDRAAHWQATSLDFVMMVVLASKERTEKQWYKLLEGVGLKVAKIWTRIDSAESLIECDLI